MADTINADGLLVRFGRTQGIRGARAGVTSSTQKLQEMVITVDLAGAARTIFTADRNNDGVNDGFSGLDAYLPASALIKSQQVITLVTPVGGTNYAVGTYSAVDGTVDNAIGIRTTTGVDGAQVNTVLAAKRYVALVTTGVYTAGRLKVIIQYMIP